MSHYETGSEFISHRILAILPEFAPYTCGRLPDRYHGRGTEYAAALLESYTEDVERDGWVIISHHDSVTGRIVYYEEGPRRGSDGQLSMF